MLYTYPRNDQLCYCLWIYLQVPVHIDFQIPLRFCFRGAVENKNNRQRNYCSSLIGARGRPNACADFLIKYHTLEKKKKKKRRRDVSLVAKNSAFIDRMTDTIYRWHFRGTKTAVQLMDVPSRTITLRCVLMRRFISLLLHFDRTPVIFQTINNIIHTFLSKYSITICPSEVRKYRMLGGDDPTNNLTLARVCIKIMRRA